LYWTYWVGLALPQKIPPAQVARSLSVHGAAFMTNMGGAPGSG
jgi:hypothetical protein